MKSSVEYSASGRALMWAYALLAFTALCWGGNSVLGRLAVGEVSPVAVVLLRWLGVCLIIAPLVPRRIARDWNVLRPHLGRILLMGAFGFSVFNVMFYSAARYTSAINLGILQGSMPVLVLMGAYVAYKTRVTVLQMIGVCVTAVGVFTVAAGGDLARLATLKLNLGDVLMLAACTLYSGYVVALRSMPAVSPISVFGALAASALIASVPLVAIEYVLGALQWPTLRGWVVIALIVLFPSCLAQIAFIKGVNAIGPGRAGIFVNLVPVFAPILAVVVLGESFEFYHFAALCFVIGGIALAERYRAAEWPAQDRLSSRDGLPDDCRQ